MNVSDLATALNLKVLFKGAERSVSSAYTSDLLSDVMGNAPDECVLITIQAHKNTVAVATLKDSPAIIICNNRPVADDMLEAAKLEDIAILLSDESQFVISGKLFALLDT